MGFEYPSILNLSVSYVSSIFVSEITSRSIFSFIMDTRGSNFGSIKFIFNWAIIGRSSFLDFRLRNMAFGLSSRFCTGELSRDYVLIISDLSEGVSIHPFIFGVEGLPSSLLISLGPRMSARITDNDKV